MESARCARMAKRRRPHLPPSPFTASVTERRGPHPARPPGEKAKGARVVSTPLRRRREPGAVRRLRSCPVSSGLPRPASAPERPAGGLHKITPPEALSADLTLLGCREVQAGGRFSLRPVAQGTPRATRYCPPALAEVALSGLRFAVLVKKGK